MPLYTIVLEHMGGTYIAQVTARSTSGALRQWARRAPLLGIPHITTARAAVLQKSRDFCEPVVVAGTRNVWCTSAVVRGELALFHIVMTDLAQLATRSVAVRGRVGSN